MKKMLTLIALVAIAMFLVLPVSAQTYSNTLYGQEGTSADGYAAINAAGQAPAGSGLSANYTNWKYQTGSGSYSAIYSWDGDAWLTIAAGGDSSIDVEADIEMYWSETIANNKIYYHIGNPYTATDSDKQAIVSGTYACNNTMYIGISFDGTSKTDSSFEKVGSAYTGKVLGGMVGTTDIGGRAVNSSFDISFLCRLNGGAFVAPTSFGDGSHGTQHKTLWWSPAVTGMTLGTGTMQWLVQIYPTAAQPDGNYHLDPVVVTAPEI